MTKRMDRAVIELATSPETLIDLLLDYGQYADWLPGLSQSRILAQEGDITVVEFETQHLVPYPVTFEFVHIEPQRILFQQVGQLGERGLSGTISVFPIPASNTARLGIETCLQVPFHRLGVRHQLREPLHQALESLTTHLQSISATAAQPSTASRRLILQVRRLEGALEVWHRGRLFTSPLESGETRP
jgi:hypothetical protein